ncbi:MAG TPA: hypothetical protein VGD98_06570 [Ktedonobacteraceae bacterium]
MITQFHLWLFVAALLFALGGLFFWLMLLLRVIRPLHTLAIEHQSLPVSEQSIPSHATRLARRADEVGNLAHSLVRLELDGLEKLGRLQTLLETSNAVVGSLEPRAVVGQIIREARRLVDVQAAAVLLPDEHGVLRVLVSDGLILMGIDGVVLYANLGASTILHLPGETLERQSISELSSALRTTALEQESYDQAWALIAAGEATDLVVVYVLVRSICELAGIRLASCSVDNTNWGAPAGMVPSGLNIAS